MAQSRDAKSADIQDVWYGAKQGCQERRYTGCMVWHLELKVKARSEKILTP